MYMVDIANKWTRNDSELYFLYEGVFLIVSRIDLRFEIRLQQPDIACNLILLNQTIDLMPAPNI